MVVVLEIGEEPLSIAVIGRREIVSPVLDCLTYFAITGNQLITGLFLKN